MVAGTGRPPFQLAAFLALEGPGHQASPPLAPYQLCPSLLLLFLSCAGGGLRVLGMGTGENVMERDCRTLVAGAPLLKSLFLFIVCLLSC